LGLQFFSAWRIGVFAGVFRKNSVQNVVFDGKNVVICGHNVVVMRRFFNSEKYANFSALFFHKNPLP
jgi:hypothetical protein